MTNRTTRVSHRREGGQTLLEVMISMVIFLVGMAGLLGMHMTAGHSDAYASKIDRATAVGQDLMSYLQSIPYTSPLLVAGPAGRDLLDGNETFELKKNLVQGTDFDYDDASLQPYDPALGGSTQPLFTGYLSGGASTNGWRPTLDFNGDGTPDMQRYWLVEDLPANSKGRVAGKVISVIVRWAEPATGNFRRVVLMNTRFNPQAITP